MASGGHKLGNTMAGGLGRVLMNAGRFCFSCEQIFSSRRCLEEHVCSATTFICSCGTEFTVYKDMFEHSTSHEPGHQVLDHETIRKRRMEKRKEEEEQLKRFQKGEVVWKAPKLASMPSVSLSKKPMCQVSSVPQVPKQSAQISQVPEWNPSLSQASFLPSPTTSSVMEMKNNFADVGSPTVDLWTLYQPVVLLQTTRKSNREKPYTCGKCGQCFVTKTSLISHNTTHVSDKVSGCIGCGLLLSSRKLVPRFHVCNSSRTSKFRIITARPPWLNQVRPGGGLKQSTGGPQATSPREPKSQNVRAADRGSQAPHVTSTLQFKNLNFKTYSRSKERLNFTSSLQLKRQNPSQSMPRVTVSLPPKRQSPNPFVSNRNGRRLPVTPSRQLKTPLNSASSLWSEPTKTSFPSYGFTCRVCRIPFETALLLQRHKCIRAQEFMARHVNGGKQHCKVKRVTPVASPNPAQMNGERKLGIPASGDIMKNQVMVIGLDKGVVPVNHKTAVDMEDDCYIVESKPDKSAEMIYQVTSSVPIQT